MKKVFSTLLFIIFILTFAIFVYRSNLTPTVVKTSANSTAIEKDIEKAKNSDISKEEIGKIVKEYLLENPDVLYNVLEELQKRKADEQQQKASDYLKDNLEQITSEGMPPVMGSPDADITVVLFFDYNCNYCKQAHAHIKKVLETDKKAKFVLRPMPILGESSVYIAKTALALHKIAPGRFEEMHDKLMQTKSITPEFIKEMVESYGIEFKAVENEINSYAIKNLITQNYELAKNLGIRGAPSHIINGTFVPGLLEADKYEYIFKAMRANMITSNPNANAESTPTAPAEVKTDEDKSKADNEADK